MRFVSNVAEILSPAVRVQQLHAKIALASLQRRIAADGW